MNDLLKLRKKLHETPELSCQESHTQEIILDFLKSFEPTKVIKLAANKALLIEFDSGQPGKNIVFRADLDALPVIEENQFAHASKNHGVSHKCGHDGHMTLACSLPAIWKSKKRSGKLGLLFQHAEEIAVGAKEITEDKKFLEWKPDVILGLHNLPGFGSHELVYSKDIFSCASMGIRFSFIGTSSHAGEPAKALSPLSTLIKLIEKANSLISPNEDDAFFLSTLVHMKLGEENYGITPGDGIICFTLRSKTTDLLLKNKKLLITEARDLAKEKGLTISVDEFDFFPATCNTSQTVDEIQKAASSAGLKTVEKDFPFKWSEDFGYFSDICPTAYFGIGNGKDSYPLHHPAYDFNDSVIESFQKLFRSYFS